jgi:hypothetical protein
MSNDALIGAENDAEIEWQKLLLEGFAMATMSGLSDHDDAEFFAKGFALGHICAQTNTTNLSFKKTIDLWNDLKQRMQDDGVL